MPNDPTRTPDYLIELAAAGELDPEMRHAVLERAAGERGGADPIAPLARDDAETLARFPPGDVATEVAHRAARARGRSRARWFAVPIVAAAGAAAAAAILVVPARPPPPGATQVDGTRVKGRAAPHLVVHRRTRSGAEVIAPGALARPGDLLQLGYVSGRGFGAIVSLDGRGVVTRHWPLDGVRAGALVSGREVLLAESFRLDDAPGFERFILVTAEQPFEIAGVLDAARAAASRADSREAPLPLAGGLEQTSVVVQKEVR